MGQESFLNLPHSIITRPSTCSEYYGEFRHLGACYRSNQLSPVFSNAALLGVGTNHETADVL